MNGQYMKRRVFTALASTKAFHSLWPLKGSSRKSVWFGQSWSSSADAHRLTFCSQPSPCPVLPPAHFFIKVFFFLCRLALMAWFTVWSFHCTVGPPKAHLNEYQCRFAFILFFQAKTDSLFFCSSKQVPDPRLSTHYCWLNKSYIHTHTPTIFSYPLATHISIFSYLLSQELFGGEHGARLINDIWSG